ncbi:hypothetical protein [Desulfosudis oleivorans]|uniref:Uncharacterized protein n=1 Tax=Desulfosudis oleivorans (strain DSM 6200 / JCM 39069 / Hxd3) TaxID=96561 RepID=A8ZVW5_DESOH|nr:hypothetical protein [Desulfosudis oleivorans]ABW66674.1 hypothetical protein Dole_0864 [Desulfosudis oleivorans Hxd3]
MDSFYRAGLVLLLIGVLLLPACGGQSDTVQLNRQYEVLNGQIDALKNSIADLEAELAEELYTSDIKTARATVKNKLARARKALDGARSRFEFEDQRGHDIGRASWAINDAKRSLAGQAEGIRSANREIKSKIQRLCYMSSSAEFREAINELRQEKTALIADCRQMLDAVDISLAAAESAVTAANWISADDETYFKNLISDLKRKYDTDYVADIRRIKMETERIDIQELDRRHRPADRPPAVHGIYVY